MIEISGAISGISAGLQAIKAAVAARDEAKIDAAISTLKDRLFDLQTANLEVVEQLHAAQTKLHTLVRENDQLKSKAADLGLYALQDLSNGRGIFYAYAYKATEAGGQGQSAPFHYLCQPCLDNTQRKGVLRTFYSAAGPVFTCPVCNTSGGV